MESQFNYSLPFDGFPSYAVFVAMFRKKKESPKLDSAAISGLLFFSPAA